MRVVGVGGGGFWRVVAVVGGGLWVVGGEWWVVGSGWWVVKLSQLLCLLLIMQVCLVYFCCQ